MVLSVRIRKDDSTCYLQQAGVSSIGQMDIQGKSKININVPVETVIIAKEGVISIEDNAFLGCSG